MDSTPIKYVCNLGISKNYLRFQEDFLLPVRFQEDFSSDYFYGRDEGDLGLGEAIILTGKSWVS